MPGAPTPPPQQFQCPNCGYPVLGKPQFCPTCGFRLDPARSSCRLVLSIVLLVMVALVGGAIMMLAACAVGMSGKSPPPDLDHWALAWVAGLVVLFVWMMYEIVLMIRSR